MKEQATKFFLNPANLHPCRDISQGKVTIPQSGGIYAWYFKPGLLSDKLKPEWLIPVGEEGLGLCYLGISPDEEASDENLRERLKTHLEKTARNSTLRYSLGALLTDTLNLEVIPHGERKLSFGVTEGILTEWIREHGRVAWYKHEKPWDVEKSLIRLLHPPLNLKGNPLNPFKNLLEMERKRLRERAHGDQLEEE